MKQFQETPQRDHEWFYHMQNKHYTKKYSDLKRFNKMKQSTETLYTKGLRYFQLTYLYRKALAIYTVTYRKYNRETLQYLPCNII